MVRTFICGLTAAVVSGVVGHFVIGTDSPAAIMAAYGFLIFMVGYAMGHESPRSSSEHDDEKYVGDEYDGNQ
jgi:hypothetical protein